MSEEEVDEEVEFYARSMRIVRDIAFFFHQQSEYEYVMEDLDYTFFTEKYWDALVEDPEMPLEIQRGCLALLYAMGMYEGHHVGRALGNELPLCIARLKQFEPGDGETKTMLEITLRALSAAAVPLNSRDWQAVRDLDQYSAWIYERSVRPYFQSRVRDLEHKA